MKKINKILILTLMVLGAFFYSCETLELENTVDPNVLSPELADANLLFNTIQLQYAASSDVNRGVTVFNNLGEDLGRISYFFGRNYFNNLGSGTLNGPWGDLYSDIIPDITAIEGLNSEDNDLSFQIGVSKILQAHLMMLLVDYLGDIPFSQANNPTEFPSPMVDDDAEVYAAAIGLLDEALGLLDGADAGSAFDLYFDGDADKWIKVANTLKMRANLTTKNYAAVIAAGNVIESVGDDLQFSYGDNELQPDTRHPDYVNDYTDGGANIYASNWLMDLMVGPVNLDANTIDGALPCSDPRRRFYFYRQNAFTPGNFTLVGNEDGTGITVLDNETNGETLQCSLQNVPNHLEFTPDEDIWCSVKLGYWGRIHGSDEGTPPDGFTRTAVGVYPAGGRFDDNLDYVVLDDDGDAVNYSANVGLGLGGGGAGIEPIILSSFVEFWRAEALLMTGDVDGAKDAFEAGIRESISKVQTFGSLDANADFTVLEDNDDDDDTDPVEDFVTKMVDMFDSAPATSGLDGLGFPTEKDKMDLLGEQFFVAMYGGGADAYNFIRRTGYPRTLSRNIEGNPGTFPRSVLYPNTEVSSNPNLSQRTDLSDQVFWDTGVTNPAN